MDVNEFRDVRTVQLIVQDFKPSERFCEECVTQQERYRAVRMGGAFHADECFVPDREDFAHVYTVLRREFRLGIKTLSPFSRMKTLSFL